VSALSAETCRAVTSAEIQSLFQRFRALDRRHKGYISGEELMNVPELAMNPLAQRVVQMFENCNFKDFVRLLSAFSQRSSRAEQLRWLFELYDVDGDGAVSRADLLTLMRNRAGSQLTDEQLGELVDRALQGVPPGASGERQLSFEAFCQEFAGYSAPAGATLLKVKVPTDC
jgi:Ca2+-binding EF-hand superfamily protein